MNSDLAEVLAKIQVEFYYSKLDTVTWENTGAEKAARLLEEAAEIGEKYPIGHDPVDLRLMAETVRRNGEVTEKIRDELEEMTRPWREENEIP